MADYRIPNMMGRPQMPRNDQRSAMYNQRMAYQRPAAPEAVCNQKPEPEEKCANDMCEDRGNFPIAMAYVPWQKWCEIYDLEEAFAYGTIFKELDKRFYFAGGGCR